MEMEPTYCASNVFVLYSIMPSSNDTPQIQVDSLDLELKTDEEHIQLALEAVVCNGFKENGQPWLSLCEAARCFDISKSKLTAHFNERKTRKEAHEHEKALSFAAAALVEWIAEMGRRCIPLHASAVAQHASVILGSKISEQWVH